MDAFRAGLKSLPWRVESNLSLGVLIRLCTGLARDRRPCMEPKLKLLADTLLRNSVGLDWRVRRQHQVSAKRWSCV
jgi:hypothetical protein